MAASRPREQFGRAWLGRFGLDSHRSSIRGDTLGADVFGPLGHEWEFESYADRVTTIFNAWREAHAEILWEEFEHLVRELFGRIFAEERWFQAA